MRERGGSVSLAGERSWTGGLDAAASWCLLAAIERFRAAARRQTARDGALHDVRDERKETRPAPARCDARLLILLDPRLFSTRENEDFSSDEKSHKSV